MRLREVRQQNAEQADRLAERDDAPGEFARGVRELETLGHRLREGGLGPGRRAGPVRLGRADVHAPGDMVEVRTRLCATRAKAMSVTVTKLSKENVGYGVDVLHQGIGQQAITGYEPNGGFTRRHRTPVRPLVAWKSRQPRRPIPP